MSVEKIEPSFDYEVSTYGVVTAERILGRYQIKLPSNELARAVKSTSSFFHKLLEVPLKNILNGIVLQQAKDYQIYAQQLLMDYILSAHSKPGEEQESMSRHDIVQEEQNFQTLAAEFRDLEQAHNQLIAESQTSLIRITQEFNAQLAQVVAELTMILTNDSTKMNQAITHALIVCDLNQNNSETSDFIEAMNQILQLSLDEHMQALCAETLVKLLDKVSSIREKMYSYQSHAQELSSALNATRKQFYEFILRVKERLITVPEYRINPIQDSINLEALNFDSGIGG